MKGINKEDKRSKTGIEDRNFHEFKQKVKIGAFFITIFLILAIFIMFVGDLGILIKKKGYSLYVPFDTVIGLAKRSYVRMSGLKIGYVKDIQLKGNHPEVELQIDPAVKVQKGSKATMATAGLIGEKYVEIIPGEEEGFFQPGDSLLPEVSFDIEKLGKMFLSVGEDVKAVGESIKMILGKEESATSVQDALKDLLALTSNLKEFLSENRQGVKQGIQSTTKAVDSFEKKVGDISLDLEEFVAVMKEMVEENRGSIKLNLEKIKDLIEKTEESLRLLNESLEKINKGEGTVGKLIQDPDLYERADETMRDIEKIISPLVSMNARFGLSAEYFGQSKLLKNTFMVDVWAAKNKYFLGQAVYDPWLDVFIYSVQGGFRMGPIVPRVGILESKVGAGLDVYTLKDRLLISLEGFDFNRLTSPRFRAWTRYSATKNLYIIIGIDDFTLAPNREFYFGLGLGL
ncbi:MlaD family protein [Acidobacteriota bacterium]